MATIEIFQPGKTTEDESAIKKTIELEGIDFFRITPVNTKVGARIPMTELSDLIAKIEPIEQPQQEELDSYYAQHVFVYEDGDLSPKKLDLPHHIGLRVVLESVLQKYGTFNNMQIQIR